MQQLGIKRTDPYRAIWGEACDLFTNEYVVIKIRIVYACSIFC